MVPEDGVETCANAEKPGGGNLSGWLFNPFRYFAGGKALSIGLVSILAAGAVAALANCRFDSVLGFHIGSPERVALWLYFAGGYISWLLMGALLLAGGKIISSHDVQALDVFGTQALARCPTFISALSSLFPGSQRYAQSIIPESTGISICRGDAIFFALTMLIVVLMTIWMAALMYRGFTVSSNVSGWKAVAVFTIALVLGQALSLAVLFALV